MNEHFVFPFVGMHGGVSARGNLENSHAEIVCSIILANDHTCSYPFYLFGVEVSRLHFRVPQNLHDVLRKSRILRTGAFAASKGRPINIS
jgi:hypothetical protein